MRSVPFNSLPQRSRERLLACLNGKQAPQALLTDKTSMGFDIFAWAALEVIGWAILLVILIPGFGEYWSGNASQGFWAIVGYAIAVWLIVLGLLGIVRRIMLRKALPWVPARYVLPMDIIDARRETLKIFPLNELSDFQETHHHSNGRYTHTSFVFKFAGGGSQRFNMRGKARADATLAQFHAARSAVRQAIERRNTHALAPLDPLHDARVNDWKVVDGADRAANGVPRSGPTAKRLPVLMNRAGLIGLLLGAILAYPIFHVRNERSKTQAAEVMLAEATATHDVRKLREIKTIVPGSTHAQRADAVIGSYYDEAIANFKTRAVSADAQLVPAFVKLIEYLRDHDSPAVQVRFRSPSLPSLAAVDAKLQQQNPGKVVFPVSPHFTDSLNEQRETQIAKSLAGSFDRVFANKVLTLEHGPRLEDTADATDWSTINVPVLEVDYVVVAPGATDVYTSIDNPSLVYARVVVRFAVTIHIPGESGEPYAYRLLAEPPRNFGALAREGTAATPESVYNTMVSRAFERLDQDVQRRFLGIPLPPEE